MNAIFKHSLQAVAATAALGAIGPAAQAATIVGLFNTGTDASNNALAGGNGVAEIHYTIVSSNDSAFSGGAPQTYFNGAYAADTATSRWISLNGSGGGGNSTTTYRLTFSLAGLDAATAVISGLWGVDNQGQMILNGVNVGALNTTFSSLTSFTVSSGFLSGTNTLDFRVTDFGPPTALRVAGLTGTANLANVGGVPEPATWAMMLAGFGLVGFALRSHKRESVRVRFG